MSERGDSPEGFLQRWSRKKVEAQHDPDQTPAAENIAEANPPAAPEQEPRAPAAATPPHEKPPEPAFDIASLPPIESITAATDVRSFLAPGVPRELARAALRRAWITDPAIRDFVGLQENDWDFNNPEGIPGFGRIAPGEDLKKLVAQVFGETDATPGEAPADNRLAQLPASPAESAAQDTPASSALSTSDAADERDAEVANADSAIVQRINIAASQDESADPDSASSPAVRKHGSALPE
jgi:hypothetical protein